MPRRRRLYGINELCPAEVAWLTGEKPDEFNADDWDDFFLWSLEEGFPSYHEGRKIWPSELLEQYGHLVPADRVQFLRLQIKRERRRPDQEQQLAEVIPLRPE